MDYIRISGRCMATDPVEVPTADDSQLTAKEVKDLLKDWIKLYPNSFAPDVEFKIYQLEDGDIIIQLHDDLSSMAVSLLVLYFETISQQTNSQQPTAFITVDDAEVLLKHNEGKRTMIFCSPRVSESASLVRFLLDDNYVLDYNFEKRPKPVKDCDMVFEEPEFSLPEEYELVVVGDVVKKKIDAVLEDEGLTPKKMLIYLLCGAVGLSIGFLIVSLMSK